MPPKLITPKEFVDATALGVFSPRGPETKAIDKAYDAYYHAAVGKDPTAPQLKIVSLNLLQALTALVLAKGGDWDLVNRDKASHGMLREWHAFLDLHWGADLARTIAAEKAVLGWDLVHSRFGVVYLLGNLEVGIDWRIMLGELVADGGAAAVATGMAASGHATTFGESNVSLGVTHSSTATLTSGSAAATRLVKTGVAHPTAHTTGHTASRFDIDPQAQWVHTSAAYPKSVAEAFPTTADLFHTAVKQYQGVGDLPGTIVGGIIGGSVALATDIVKTTVETLWKALHDLINWIQKKMFHDDEFAAKTIASVAKPIAAVVIQQVWKTAAPFVSGGMQIVTGISQTIKAAIDKVALWWDRSQVTLTAGHFALIGESIESQLTKGLFHGLWTALKGAGDIALNSFLPGAGTLVSMIMGGVEWLIKSICRVVEHAHIGQFLATARNLWTEEKALARHVSHVEQDLAAKGVAASGPGHLEPPKDNPDSICHDTKRFADWFRKGCEASVVIPMITLSSGMCGGIYQAIEILEPVGKGAKTGTRIIDQKAFDAGVAYFDRLKRVSHEYLVSSGFIFSSGLKELEGVVHHACMDNHHLSRGMKLLTGLAT